MTTDRSCEIVEADWLDIWDEGVLLHYAPGLTDDDDETYWEDVRLACGQHVDSARIPGFATRMSAWRCGACCDIRGLPHGKGSPKNDDACRTILGLSVDAPDYVVSGSAT